MSGRNQLALGGLKLGEGLNVGVDNVAHITLVRFGVSQQGCVQSLHSALRFQQEQKIQHKCWSLLQSAKVYGQIIIGPYAMRSCHSICNHVCKIKTGLIKKEQSRTGSR